MYLLIIGHVFIDHLLIIIDYSSIPAPLNAHMPQETAEQVQTDHYRCPSTLKIF